MRMMRDRPVLTTNLTALLIGFGMFGSYILVPQFVQVPTATGYGFGASVTDGRPVHAALGAGDARRRPDLGRDGQPLRLEAAAGDRHRRSPARAS